MLETALFYVFSVGAILAALGVISSRSAVYSVLSLVLTMCLLSGLFVLLKAFLVATILVLVYAGAILVLFLFVVMMINEKELPEPPKGFQVSVFLAALLGAAFFALSFRVISTIPYAVSKPLHGTAEAVGLSLFQNYALPFELTSFLLLAAVLSVVVLAKKAAK